jgi:uncharacterized protein (TIGR02996 family)
VDEQTALIAAIRAEPDEDTRRLVFADWLDEHPCEHGLEAAWASLIRTQIDLHRMVNSAELRTETYDDRFSTLLNTETELLTGPLGDWFADQLGGVIDPELLTRFDLNGIQRGFPEVLEPCDSHWWLVQAEHLLAQLPITNVAFSRLPRCEQREEGIILVEEYSLSPPVSREFIMDEETVMATCTERWPGVEFEVLRFSGEIQLMPLI